MGMAKFMKKPVVIEAVQFNGTRHWYEAPEWLIEATKKAPEEVGSLIVSDDGVASIFTLEGVHEASDGDWIIRGIKGELYPCKPDIFAATYDPAE
jgi:hypothetical protein